MPPENIRTKTIFDFDGMAQSTRLIARLLVVVAALAILFIRMPVVFIHPAFWAEDGAAYFQFSYLGGWKSISYETAGYLTLIQWLVANFSARFPVSTAPAMFLLAATVLTLIVVWLITSPRLPLPAKPLLALTVVIVPAGYEVLGTLANVQWITPIGAFAILLMRPSKSLAIGAAELFFILAVSLTGPFSLLLLPVCGLQIILNRGDTAARRRILILTGIVAIGATIESVYLARNLANALPIDLQPISSSWQLWAVLPIARITAPLGHAVLRTFGETASLPIAITAYGIIAYFATRAPYRAQKIAMLLFAFAIIAAGMFKLRLVLPLTGLRFFYAAQVFSVWFFCCVPQTSKVREIFNGIVAIALLILVFFGANRPRATENSEWPVWSRQIRSGLPVKIPTAPRGWFVTLPADPNGPLARFAAMEGKNLNELGFRRDDSLCTGAIDSIESAPEANGEQQQIVRGWVKPLALQNRIVAIVVTGSKNQVVGFAIPGFVSSMGQGFGWAGVVRYPKTDISAFAIFSPDYDAICQLAH